jgi:N-acetylneuraminic acid mutarotase
LLDLSFTSLGYRVLKAFIIKVTITNLGRLVLNFSLLQTLFVVLILINIFLFHIISVSASSSYSYSFSSSPPTSSMLLISYHQSSLLLWSKGANIPTPRSEVAGVIVGGEQIYVIGGFTMPSNATGPRKTNVVEVYNIKNNTWSSVARLPEKMDHVGAAEHNGKIYVVGGSVGKENNPSNKLFIFDPSINKWQEGKPMPTPRAALSANFIDGILYAVGGVNSSRIPVTTNEAYNPQTNTWTHKTPMPTPRHHLTSAVVDGKLYVIGGRDNKPRMPIVNLNVNERYNPKYDNWTILKPMPTFRSGLAAAVSNDDKIYVFGGQDSIQTFDNNEKYNPKTNNWTTELPMPTARHGLAAVSDHMSDRIFLIGGGIDAGDNVSNVNEIFLPVDIFENQLVK